MLMKNFKPPNNNNYDNNNNKNRQKFGLYQILDGGYYAKIKSHISIWVRRLHIVDGNYFYVIMLKKIWHQNP